MVLNLAMNSKPRYLAHSIFLLGMTCSMGSYSQDTESSGTAREENRSSAFISFGSPAPSFISGGLSVQYRKNIQFVVSGGYAWPTDLNILTLHAGARVQMFPTNFTPVLGAGVSFFFLSGRGSFRQLDASTLLGTLLLGAEWAFASSFRVVAGYYFHYPVALSFPFVELHYLFN